MFIRASKCALPSILLTLKVVGIFRAGLGLLGAIITIISYIPDHPEFSV